MGALYPEYVESMSNKYSNINYYGIVATTNEAFRLYSKTDFMFANI